MPVAAALLFSEYPAVSANNPAETGTITSA